MSTKMSRRPILIATKGHPATGKSVIAEALATTMQWPLIDKDDVKDHVLHHPDANDISYAVMWQIAGTQLALGLNVIAVSPLSSEKAYTAAYAVAEKNRAGLLVLETVLDEAEWRRRLEARPADGSAHKVRGWDSMQAMLRSYGGSYQYPIAPEHLFQVNTQRPVDELVAQVLERLKIEV
ncbi:MAG: AAA family ATPase [Anaerolineales bacterium]|nr:AAA family ATPase [Anaerolineales bacterium]